MYLTYEISEEFGLHDLMKVVGQGINVFYDWLPCDPSAFRQENIYIRVAQ